MQCAQRVTDEWERFGYGSFGHKVVAFTEERSGDWMLNADSHVPEVFLNPTTDLLVDHPRHVRML